MSDLSRISCACLAAGSSSRMGASEHKLSRLLHGKPVLQQTLEQLDSMTFGQKILVLGYSSETFRAMAQATAFAPVVNSNYASGMHGSIRAAVAAVSSSTEALLIVLADQPFQLSATLEEFFTQVGSVTTRTLARAWHGSTPGHPVLIGREFFQRILAQPDGDYGCAYLFRENSFAKIELGESVLWDLDTPEQFEDYSKR